MTKLGYRLWEWSKRWWFVPTITVVMAISMVGWISIISDWRNRSLSAADLVYFRDDVNMHCYAYLRGHPNSLVVVQCELVRW